MKSLASWKKKNGVSVGKGSLSQVQAGDSALLFFLEQNGDRFEQLNHPSRIIAAGGGVNTKQLSVVLP